MSDPEIIAAIISLCGVFVSISITFLIGFWTHSFNYKRLFAETVSTNRMDWINVWRENISCFLACAEMLHNHKGSSDKLLDIEKEFYESRAMITSRLNLKEQDHRTMLVLINSFVVECTEEEFVNQREAILALARKILKPEWERVKGEANGKKHK